jgi:hypothetical protein
MRRTLALIGSIFVLAVTAAPAIADPSPPTNGGNGAGHSGQCTGNPADRPAVCPATG